MSIETKYPLLSKFVYNTYSGNISFTEFCENVDATNLEMVESSLENHQELVEDGMPYPNTDVAFDNIRNGDLGLQMLQLLLDYWD